MKTSWSPPVPAVVMARLTHPYWARRPAAEYYARRAQPRPRVYPPAERKAARALAYWHEDFGPVLWWRFPVNEPPYVGTPMDDDWPGYHTHWTTIEVPVDPHCPHEWKRVGKGPIDLMNVLRCRKCGRRRKVGMMTYTAMDREGKIYPP